MNSTTIHARAIARTVLLICTLSLSTLIGAATPSVAVRGSDLTRAQPNDWLSTSAPIATWYTAAKSSGGPAPAWSQQKTSAGDGAADDNYGYVVSVSGATAVVGVPNAGAGNDGRGFAHVFTRSNGIWTEQQELTADDAAMGDGFGFSVSISGDAVLIGAPYATVGGNGNQGAAYVFTRSNGLWIQAQKLGPDDGAANVNFGWAVALSGATALVSSPAAAVGANALQGKAYVFADTGGNWNQAHTLLANDGGAFATFGSAVALDGNTAVIGAAGIDSYFGAAYVFDGSDGRWAQTGKLIPGDGVVSEFFGTSVAASGTSALVGAYNQRIEGHNAEGAAYLFTESDGAWMQQQKLTASDAAANARFGLSVALAGSSALVGSYFADVGGNAQQGAAYIFTQSNGNWSETNRLVADDGATNDHFGNAVALSGATALVGALDASIAGHAQQGAAYFFAPPSDVIFADGFNGGTPPSITSADSATFLVGQSNTLTITASGDPAPTVIAAGALPGGVAIVDNGNGTATLSGNPAAGSDPAYPITLTAHDGSGVDAIQTFTLNIHEAPAFTSANNTTFVVAVAGTFTLTTTGYPRPSIALGVALPNGVTFIDNGDGTATLGGTPVASVGAYPLTFTATNVVGSAPQAFTLTLTAGAPALASYHSSAAVSAIVGSSLAFGNYPSVLVTDQGLNPVPADVTFSVISGACATVPAAGFNVAVDASGIASMSAASLILPAIAGTCVVGASTTPAVNGSPLNFTVQILDAHAMTFAQAPSATSAIADVLPVQPIIQIRDVNGNPIAKSGVVIVASIGDASGGPYPDSLSFTATSTTTATTDSSGLATFTNLGILGVIRPGLLTFHVASGSTESVADISSPITLTPGTPSMAENSSGALVSTTVGINLGAGLYPSVRIRDVSGNLVSSAATSVTFSIVSGSACSITGSPIIATDGSGQATLSNLVLPSAPGSCVVHAVLPSPVSPSSFDFIVVIAPPSGFTWLGVTNDDYTIASNWRDGSVPGAADVIFVPTRVPNSPMTLLATTIAQVTMEAGANFTVGADALTVTGTMSAGSSSLLTVSSAASATFQGASTTLANLGVNAGTVQFNKAATITGNLITTGSAVVKHQNGSTPALTISGSLDASSGTTLNGLNTVTFTGSTFPVYRNPAVAGSPRLTKIAANMSVPAGSPAVAGELQVSDANLTISDTNSLTVNGDFDVAGANGQLTMFGSPTLTVVGTTIFEGRATQGQALLDGTLVLQGDFVQRDRTTGAHGEFEPGPNFTVMFAGNSAQSVSFDHPGDSPGTESQFTNVVVTNQGGVTQYTDVYVEQPFSSGMILGVPGLNGVWNTFNNTLFMGSALRITLGSRLVISSGGHLDLGGGGTCTATDLSTGLISAPGGVEGGICVQGDVGRIDNAFMPYAGLR